MVGFAAAAVEDERRQGGVSGAPGGAGGGGAGGDAPAEAVGPEAVGAACGTARERMRRVACRVLRDSHAAEDATQDAFLAALRSVRTLRDPSRMEAWLVTITRNVATSHRRRLRRVRPHLGASVAGLAERSGDCEAAGPWDGVLASDPSAEAVAAVREAFEALPGAWRRAFRERVIEGRPYAEIAEDHGVTVNVIRSRMSRVWRRLQDEVRDEARAPGNRPKVAAGPRDR